MTQFVSRTPLNGDELFAASLANMYARHSIISGISAPSAECFLSRSAAVVSHANINSKCGYIVIGLEFVRSIDLLYRSLGALTFSDRESSLDSAVDAVRRIMLSSLIKCARYDLILEMQEEPNPWVEAKLQFAARGRVNAATYSALQLLIGHEIGHINYRMNDKFRSNIDDYMEILGNQFGINPNVQNFGIGTPEDLHFRTELGISVVGGLRSPSVDEWRDELAADIWGIGCLGVHERNVLSDRPELNDLGMWLLLRAYEIAALFSDLLNGSEVGQSIFMARRYLMNKLIQISRGPKPQDRYLTPKIITLNIAFNRWSKRILAPVVSKVLELYALSGTDPRHLSTSERLMALTGADLLRSEEADCRLDEPCDPSKRSMIHDILSVERIAGAVGFDDIMEWCAAFYGDDEVALAEGWLAELRGSPKRRRRWGLW